MIELNGLTKRYGDKLAVSDLTVDIRPGLVTGFLGPNGAGKSTTMRLILGLDKPTAGRATIDGRRLVDCPAPLTEVGALLDAKGVPGGRSGRDHLLALAASQGIGRRRVDQVLELCGLGDAARQAFKTYSLGMGQRLGIAAALLGDPKALILDEPVNGLDPEGVLWVRGLVRHLAHEGRTVFLSSHLMSEMAQTADHLIVIGQGRLLADKPVEQLLSQASETATRVSSPQIADIIRVLGQLPGVNVTIESSDSLVLHGLAPLPIGQTAAAYGWVLSELTPIISSLEDAYLGLTEGAVDYRSTALV
ncbi:MAG: ATP-binding cassette domain-containing protein [Propionibacteriaceae bacterium]|jgi:ABC-2 type transport system ATP-binding protein|nr:ATP-binding cassette domain-containing protein [Propionibacteriaceae bacterium]